MKHKTLITVPHHHNKSCIKTKVLVLRKPNKIPHTLWAG